MAPDDLKKNSKQTTSPDGATPDPYLGAASAEPEAPLVEGVDYEIEDGLFVLTRGYLLARGYCCECGCRHCPFKTSQK